MMGFLESNDSEKVCAKEPHDSLDSLALRGFTLCNEIIVAKLNLEKVMGSGFGEMARARYIMGVNSVSALQLPQEGCSISPSVTVNRREVSVDVGAAQVAWDSFLKHEDSPKEDEHLPPLEGTEVKDQKSSSHEKDSEKNSEDEERELEGDTENIVEMEDTTSGLRRRKGTARTEQTSEPKDKTSETRSDTEKKQGHKKAEHLASRETTNPLKWFGVLVPQSLKNSQKHFQDAIMLSLEIASLEEELKNVIHKYKELKVKKEPVDVDSCNVEQLSVSDRKER